MHICIIARRINDLSGVATYARNLIKYLTKIDNIHLTVMAVDIVPKITGNVRYVWIRPFLELRNPLNPRNLVIPAISLLKKITSVYLQNHIDIIQMLDGLSFPVAHISAEIFHIPVIFRVPSLSCADTQTSPYPYQVNKLYLMANQYAARNASAVICVSKANLQIMSEWGADSQRLHLIPNFIDFDNIRQNHSKHSLSLSDDEICLFVGSLISIKGVEYLLKATAIVLTRRPKILLVIVGDGEERKNLSQLAENLSIESHIQFIGGIPHEEVSQWYKKARMLILPSLNEGFPNVILESFAHGLPVVASNVGGIPDIVKHRWNGLLVPQMDEKCIADSICELLENNSLWKQCSENAVKTVEQYAWDKGIVKILDIYNKLIRNKL